MWNRFKNFINKDVGNENEVKMYAVIIRIILMVTCLYTILSAVSAFVYGQSEYGWFSIVCFILSVVFFYLTYDNKTAISTFATIIMFLCIVTVSSYLYGLNIAVSQMIYVIIMLICAIDYLRRISIKIVAVAIVLAYRVCLFAYLEELTPVYKNTSGADSHWQTINMVAVSAMIVAVTVVSTSDFTQMREKLTKYNTRLRDVAGKDPLTGLYNRRSAIEYMNGKIDGYKEGLYNSITLVMADIDHFKKVNDTYGHDKGDEVLVSIGDTMGRFMRDKGLASRWGGEEFVLIFVDHNGDDAYGHIINLQREISAKRFFFNGDEIKITLTYGMAEQSPDASLEDTIKEADEKLYIGKEKGRNIIIF